MPVNTYIGDCAWEPVGEPQTQRRPNELPTITEPWIGREDLAAAWQQQYPVGAARFGGFIIENTPRPWCEGMMACDLTVALLPDFQKSLSEPTTSLKTATLSKQVNASNILKDESAVNAVKSVTFYARETRYRYFASAQPDGPRFGGVAGQAQPIIIRSIITVTGVANPQLTATFAGLLAPAALVSALAMPPYDSVVSLEGEQIKGTPWYEVTEVWSRQPRGDALS